MAYAEGTSVPVEKSIGEIIGLIKKAGAKRVAQLEEPAGFVVEFALHDRRIRFKVKLPALAEMPTVDGRGSSLDRGQREKRLAQAHRQRARALLLVIKAKLESVESEVETFEQAFLANVVMPDNRTVYERIAAPIELEYMGAPPAQLLLGDGR